MKQIVSLVGMRFRGTERLVSGLPAGAELRLVREPNNAHDPNAVQVHSGTTLVGYVKAKDAADLARTLDARGTPECAGRLVPGHFPSIEIDT